MRFKRLFRLRKDVVVKDDESVTHDGTGVAQSLAKLKLALAVGGQIFDQQKKGRFYWRIFFSRMFLFECDRRNL